MALHAIVRWSASAVVPLAAGLVGGQGAVNYSRVILHNKAPSFRLVSRFSSSASHAIKRWSSDESLLKVIESEIECAEESIEEVEQDQLAYKGPIFESVSSVIRHSARRYNHYYSGTLPTTINQNGIRHKIASNTSSFPSVSRYSSLASPGLNHPSGRLSELGEELQEAFKKYLETKGRIRRSLRSVFNELENQKKRKINKIDLHTDCLEVNYRTLKTVVFDPPTLAHIPYGVKYAHRKKLKQIKKLQEIKAIRAKRARPRSSQNLG